MKALTLTQPWATLIALGEKTYETRSWSTDYRGPLAIHAAAGFAPIGGKKGFRELCESHPFSGALFHHNRFEEPDDLPLGSVVATCRLVTVNPTRGEAPRASTVYEDDFGDYTEGRYQWELRDIRPVSSRIIRGHQQLWNLPADFALWGAQPGPTVPA